MHENRAKEYRKGIELSLIVELWNIELLYA